MSLGCTGEIVSSLETIFISRRYDNTKQKAVHHEYHEDIQIMINDSLFFEQCI
jgi:hypothetical protein